MKTKRHFLISSKFHSSSTLAIVSAILLFGVLAGSAQVGDYLYSGSEQLITLGPGIYDITAYGAQGGSGVFSGGLGAEMEGQFNFATATTLTLLVGGAGTGGVDGGGGFIGSGLQISPGEPGGSFLTDGGSGGTGVTPYGGNGGLGGGSGAFLGGGGGGYSGGGAGSPNDGGGGGGGSIIDPSAIAILTEVSGVASPNSSPNGEIVVTAVPEPTTLALAGLSGLSLLLIRRRK